MQDRSEYESEGKYRAPQPRDLTGILRTEATRAPRPVEFFRLDESTLLLLKYSAIALPIFLSIVCFIFILEIDGSKARAAMIPQSTDGPLDEPAADVIEHQLASGESEEPVIEAGEEPIAVVVPAHHLSNDAFAEIIRRARESNPERDSKLDPAVFDSQSPTHAAMVEIIDSELPSQWLFQRLEMQSEGEFFRRPMHSDHDAYY